MTGADIKTARTAAKMTQKQLAGLLGLNSQCSIANWENGKCPVPEKYWVGLRAVLVIPVAKPKPAEPTKPPERVKGCPDTKCVYNGFAATGTHYCPFGRCPRV